MSMRTFPLGLTEEQYGQAKALADKTGMAMADVLRQSVRLGFPRLEEQLKQTRGKGKLKPFTKEEEAASWGKGRPDDELDELAKHCVKLKVRQPDEE